MAGGGHVRVKPRAPIFAYTEDAQGVDPVIDDPVQLPAGEDVHKLNESVCVNEAMHRFF